MVKVELRGVQKRFGPVSVIPGLDLEIAPGEFVALVGPSGCGKSTLLRMIAGLDDPTSGDVLIDGKRMNDVSPKNRGVGMVFQNYALYPHMTVRENLEFSLKMARVDPTERNRRVRSAAEILGLGELLERKPSQLSGGQKQRVAMGRAMVRQPKVLLFDEPLSNLDAQLRVKVRAEIAELHRNSGSTVVYVTHDQVEAMTLANRIAVLSKGVLEQFGNPSEVYGRPKTRFVASFIGTPPMNFLETAQLPDSVRAKTPTGAAIGFRPETARLAFASAPPEAGLIELAQGRVCLIEPLGSTTYVHVRISPERVLVSEVRGGSPFQGKLGEAARVYGDPKTLYAFDEAGKLLAGGAAR